MSQSPLEARGSRTYADAWRAINILIRSDGSWSGRERNRCFRNRGDGTFEDASFTSGLDLDSDGRAFVPLDLDGDGDLDLIVKNRNKVQLQAFRNDLRPGGGPRLAIRFEGRSSNRDGVGARVWVDTDRRSLMREIVSGSGYLSQRPRQAWFGFEEGETVRRVRVRWPSGLAQEFAGAPPGRDLLLIEGAERLVAARRGAGSPAESSPSGATPGGRGPGTWLAEPVPAPDFALDVAGDGGRVRLSEHRPGTVLLNFWATWCPPCRGELAQFQSRLADFEKHGVAVLAVSVDEPGTAPEVASLATSLGLGFPVLLADEATTETYSVLAERLFDRRRALAIPTTFLVDGQGQIRKVYRGEAHADAILRDAAAGEGDSRPFEGRWAGSGPGRDFEELAAAFAERGLAAPALQMFDRALASGQRSPRLLNNLAGTLIASGDPGRAEQLLREALAAAPGLTDAQVNLASMLAEQGRVAEAESLLGKALAAQPDDVQALSLLGSIRFAQGRLVEASEQFRRAVDGGSRDPRLRENLGAALASLGRYEEALREYEEAKGLGAGSSALHTNLGVLYMQTGQAPRAAASFRLAIEADPDAPAPYLNLARVHLQAGEPPRALEWIRRARQLAPDDLGGRMLEVQALAAGGRLQEAAQLAEQVAKDHPGSAAAAELLESLR